MGEIARRIMLFYMERVESADADMGKNFQSERGAILTYCLRCYKELLAHIKTTLKQECGYSVCSVCPALYDAHWCLHAATGLNDYPWRNVFMK